jgi:hypothetical protein
MKDRLRTPILATVAAADIACFVLANMHYGEVWNGVGVFGILLFLVLFELL